jgi:uroporphyrinogen decarboxylase
MLSRRQFFLTSAAIAAPTKMTPRERIDRALRGEEVDRSPFSYWYHFLLEKYPGDRHAKATLDFHRNFRTDLVKVMSDFPYPKPSGRWYELKVEEDPFPEQIRALEIIRKGLGGNAYFIETVFNPYNQAEKLSSKQEVLRLKQENPQALLDALEAIAKSEANHARKAVATGAAGIFLAIANAEDGVLSREDYVKFSEPFDRMVLDAVASAPLNTLHLHGSRVYLDRFYKGWPAPVINYSAHATGVSIAGMRERFSGVLMGGIDERDYRTLSEDELRSQWQAARKAAGRKFILAPGCSVPNETTAEEMRRLTRVVGA